MYGDSGYLGVPKQEDVIKDEHLSQIDYRICKRPSSLKTSKDYERINWEKQMEIVSRRFAVRSSTPFS